MLRRGADAAMRPLQGWAGLGQARGAGLSRPINSLALILGRVSSSGLGYLAWVVAARLYTPSEVGIASGLVSAMMLCVQLALLGIGSALISAFPQHEGDPSSLLSTSLGIVSVASVLAAGVFLALAAAGLRELGVVSHGPVYALVFVAITLFGAIHVLFDHLSIAIRRCDQVLLRNALFGAVTIVAVWALPRLAGAASSLSIVASWTLAGLAACSLGAAQAVRSLPGGRYRAEVDRAVGRRLLRLGLPNYLLTLAERAPNWLLPIIVTELLSPADNAHWYSVWQMAWVAFLVPISVGQNLFAEVAQKPEATGSAIRHNTRIAQVLGVMTAAGVILLAPLTLSPLGRGYVTAGTTPLRILAVAVLPMLYVQRYYAVCRGRFKLAEATAAGVLSGLVGVCGAAVLGLAWGLTGMALAWLGTQSLTALWAAWRLRLLEGHEASGHDVASAFLGRPLEGRYPYLWLQAREVKVRRNRRIASVLLAVAVGLHETGERRVLGWAVGDSDNALLWQEVLQSLSDRGLSGVQLVVSGAHKGLTRAIGQVLAGAAWQYSPPQLMRDLSADVPPGYAPQVAALLRPIFAQPRRGAASRQFASAVKVLERRWPRAAQSLAAAEDEALAYLSFPRKHWGRICSSPRLVRLDREIERRSDGEGTLPDQRALEHLTANVLMEIDAEWRAGRRYISLRHHPSRAGEPPAQCPAGREQSR